MTAKKMIELIQQHHPHIKETEALLLLNQAKDEFCEESNMYKTAITTVTTQADLLRYNIGLEAGSSILKVLNVWIGDSGKEILASRIQGTLRIKDD